MAATLIWGSTWLAIKLQLTQVPPILSVGYRFCLAALILLMFCLIRHKKLVFSRKDHLFMALQGCYGVRSGLLHELSIHRIPHQWSGGGGVFNHHDMEYSEPQTVYVPANRLAGLFRRHDRPDRNLCTVLAGPGCLQRHQWADRAGAGPYRGISGIYRKCCGFQKCAGPAFP